MPWREERVRPSMAEACVAVEFCQTLFCLCSDGRRAAVRSIFVTLLMLAWLAGDAPLFAQSRGLEGYWRGSGFVHPTDGQREKIRCRVTFQRLSASVFSVRALCASQATNITQTGELRRVGSNRYAGEFYNSDFNVRGRIQTRLQGNRQSVTFRSEAGYGQLRLFRR